jgi:hypothetical protein
VHDESPTVGAEAAGGADVPEQAGVEEALLETTASDSSDDQGASDSSDDQGRSDSSDDQSLSSLPNSQDSPNGSSGLSDGHQGGLNDFGGSNTLAESLSRLELNSLQLKIYLDSIDQRISRMEPRLENVAPHVLSTSPVHTREEGAARYSATIPGATVPSAIVPSATMPAEAESNRPQSDPPVLKQQSEPVSTGIAPTTEKVASGPPASLSSRKPVALATLVGAAMLLLVASLVWRFGRDAGDAVLGRVNASVEGGAADDSSRVAPRDTSAGDSRGAAVREPQATSVSNPAESAAPAVEATKAKNSAARHMGQGPERPLEKLAPSSSTTPVS